MVAAVNSSTMRQHFQFSCLSFPFFHALHAAHPRGRISSLDDRMMAMKLLDLRFFTVL
jgi:hypothetical protein